MKIIISAVNIRNMPRVGKGAFSWGTNFHLLKLKPIFINLFFNFIKLSGPLHIGIGLKWAWQRTMGLVSGETVREPKPQ